MEAEWLSVALDKDAVQGEGPAEESPS